MGHIIHSGSYYNDLSDTTISPEKTKNMATRIPGFREGDI